jgi:hypothetical protein
MLRGSTRDVLFGMPVYLLYRPGERRDSTMQNLRTALTYLARYAPATLDRARRDLRGILVWLIPEGACGFYDRRRRLCLVDGDFAAEPLHPALLALLIAHEAMHARLHECPYGTPAERVRVERLCVKAEILVASRIPGGERMAQYLTQTQLNALDPNDYTDAAMRKRELADPRRRTLWQLLFRRGPSPASRVDA